MKNFKHNTETTTTAENQSAEMTNRQIQFYRLIEASRQAREIQEQLVNTPPNPKLATFYASRPLNYFILKFVYQSAGVKEFKKFNEWKQEGATVKKGEKAYPIWGQPIGKLKEDEAKSKGEQYKATEEENERYPICYVFSNLQVITKEERGAESC